MSYPNLLPLLEAIVYVAREPVRIEAIQKALPFATREEIEAGCQQLIERYRDPQHGVEVREVAGGLRFSTKPEHHEALKHFIQSLTPPTRLSLAALETLAVIAYKQPATIPEIQEIRGVQATGVIKTLLDKKLVATAGRKEVLGRPMLYTTTREFLVHFGLKDLGELPSMEEFEELIKSQAAAGDDSIQAELPLEELQPLSAELPLEELQPLTEVQELAPQEPELEPQEEETPPVS
jgi:segregation and condensation protein B